MDQKQMLQSCISNCNRSKSDIQSLTQSVSNTKSKDELSRANQAIDDCISHCQNAINSL
jgi:hypothetical protein